jgi:hypothetical protein
MLFQFERLGINIYVRDNVYRAIYYPLHNNREYLIIQLHICFSIVDIVSTQKLTFLKTIPVCL